MKKQTEKSLISFVLTASSALPLLASFSPGQALAAGVSRVVQVSLQTQPGGSSQIGSLNDPGCSQGSCGRPATKEEGYLLLYSNSNLAGDISFPASGSYQIKIDAYQETNTGARVGNGDAQMQVYLDNDNNPLNLDSTGKPSPITVSSFSPSTYELSSPVEISKGTHLLKVKYLNDYWNAANATDRNLGVVSLELVEIPETGTSSTAPKTPAVPAAPSAPVIPAAPQAASPASSSSENCHVYVSPNGKDANSGYTSEEPVLTLTEAQTKAQNLGATCLTTKNDVTAGSITIVVGPGTYKLSAPITLTDADKNEIWTGRYPAVSGSALSATDPLAPSSSAEDITTLMPGAPANPKTGPVLSAFILTGASNITFKQLAIAYFPQYGFYMSGSSNINIMDCDIEHIGVDDSDQIMPPIAGYKGPLDQWDVAAVEGADDNDTVDISGNLMQHLACMVTRFKGKFATIKGQISVPALTPSHITIENNSINHSGYRGGASYKGNPAPYSECGAVYFVITSGPNSVKNNLIQNWNEGASIQAGEQKTKTISPAKNSILYQSTAIELDTPGGNVPSSKCCATYYATNNTTVSGNVLYPGPVTMPRTYGIEVDYKGNGNVITDNTFNFQDDTNSQGLLIFNRAGSNSETYNVFNSSRPQVVHW